MQGINCKASERNAKDSDAAVLYGCLAVSLHFLKQRQGGEDKDDNVARRDGFTKWALASKMFAHDG